MLFSELWKIMVNKVPFVGLRGGRSPPWTCPWCGMYRIIYIMKMSWVSQHCLFNCTYTQQKLYSKMYSSSGAGGGGAGSASAPPNVLICWKSGQNPWKSGQNLWKFGQNLWKSKQKPYKCRQNPWKSGQKWGPMLFGFEKWRSRLAEKQV